ncbi:MAG: hypothetical protein K2K70_04665 [Lachnospiraceae bacterium]|nr:hypothetical protein [Lachnospiraceae bacterium]
MDFELQPLRIQAGWRMEYNNFTEYDMDVHGEKYCFELNEDLIMLTNDIANLTINLGWYPSFDLNGSYILYLVRNKDWNKPLEKVVTRSKSEVIACIEKWVCYECFSKYLR